MNTHLIAVLNKAALDAAVILDWAKNSNNLTEQERDQAASLVDRLYAASEALYPDLTGETEREALYLAIAAGTACCGGDVNAGPGWSAVEGALS